MHEYPNLNKKSTCSANIPVSQSDIYFLQADKAFATMAAKYASHGCRLTKSSSLDDVVSYCVKRWDAPFHVPDMHALKQFFAQIGGVK